MITLEGTIVLLKTQNWDWETHDAIRGLWLGCIEIGPRSGNRAVESCAPTNTPICYITFQYPTLKEPNPLCVMEVLQKDSPAPVDPTVYRDLLIFEESLRNQYLYLQKRRRKYLGIITCCDQFLTCCSFCRWTVTMVSLFLLRNYRCSKSRNYPPWPFFWCCFSITISIYFIVFLFLAVSSL